MSEDNTLPTSSAADEDVQTQTQTFTQAEVNRIVAKRVKKMQAELATLQATVEEAKRQLSAVQEMRSNLESLRRDRDSALVKSATVEHLTQQGLPLDRADVVLKLMDMSGVTVDDQGVVQGVEEALKAVLNKHPFLKPSSTPGTSSVGVNPTNPASVESPPYDTGWIKDMLLGRGRTFGRGQAHYPVSEGK